MLVVGAGPVGLFTALKLSRANLPVTVVEKVCKTSDCIGLMFRKSKF